MFRLRTLLLLGLAALVLLTLRSSFYTIDETEVGIATRFGRPLGEVEPGLHAKLPWPIDSVIRMSSKLTLFDGEPAEMLTRDKKNVLIDSYICWRISDPLRFAQTVRTRQEAEARLMDLSASELGAAVGAEPMTSFINPDPTQVRLADVSRQVTRAMDELAQSSFGIEVVDLEINGFNLPRQNRKSVTDRMRAERSRIATAYRSEGEEAALKIEAATAAERDSILAEAGALAEAIRGAGEAEALMILGEAYQEDPEFFEFLRSLESYEKILDQNTTIFIESDAKLLKVLHGN